MSDDETPPSQPKRHVWKRNRTPLSPERTQRQSLITNLAFLRLDGRDAAIAFLNTHNASLGGRPLDIAMESADGYSVVEQAIVLLARPTIGGMQ